ncbi:hypothetical protein [Bordetella sp. 2513F-2]
MSTLFFIIILVLLASFFVFYKSIKKRAELRRKARATYNDIRAAVNLWAFDRNDVDKRTLALAALEIYETWHKRAMLLPITYQHTTPEGFELIDEWRKILEEEERAAADWVSLGRGSVAAMTFREYITELRELRQHTDISS